MAFTLSHGVDLKLCPDDLLGVQQLLKEIDFPTPPLSPDQEMKEDSLEGSATLLPELQPVVPADSSDLDIDTVFKKAGLGSDTDFLDKITDFYVNPDLEFISPSAIALEEPKAILQDCMWGSITYEPRNSVNGSAGSSPEMYSSEASSPEAYTATPTPPEEYISVPSPPEVYTPAPSPPADIKEVTEDEDGGDESYEDIEEIDVVTISDKPIVSNPLSSTRLNIRKRSLSQSAPSSRQCSPAATVVGSSFQPIKRRRSHTKRTHRLNSAGSIGENIESDEEQKRASHNILERKRRNDLKKSYQALRNNIPELEDNQRAPKVTILRKATEFIGEIKVRNNDLQRKFDQEKKKELHLLQRLALLKSVLKSC